MVWLAKSKFLSQSHQSQRKKSKHTGYCFLIIFFLLSIGLVPVVFAISWVRPQASPDVGLDGAASMHGDITSSDSTPLPGPGIQDVDVVTQNFLSACPTILIRSDGKPFALCTSFQNRKPIVRLLRQKNGKEIANLELEAGSLLGGVYAYIDNQDRLVMVDGNQQLIRIKAEKINFLWFSWWVLSLDESISLTEKIEEYCGRNCSDAVVSISAGIHGMVWFVTQESRVGIYNPEAPTEDETITIIKLADHERVDNSFSTTMDGFAAIVTNEALYLLNQNDDNQPQILWRHEYDAGAARKPGQLSHGSGATPTFFGPDTGTEFVMITDNADFDISLIIRDTQDGHLVCKQAIFTDLENSGSENSAIGIGNTAIVASTYGYPYPVLPEGAGPSNPERADFVGGMVRVDINECRDDETACSPCNIVWENYVRSSAVPKISIADELIYTIERISPSGGNKTTIFDTYHFTVIDPETGDVLKQNQIGSGLFADTLQMAGNVGKKGVFWQGTLGGIVRIAPKN